MNYECFHGRLKELSALEDNWDSYGAEAPAEVAVKHARDALKILETMNFAPAGILPSAENGIGITFRAPGKYGDIEFFNDGDILAIVDDRSEFPTGDPIVWELEANTEAIKAALERIKEFLA